MAASGNTTGNANGRSVNKQQQTVNMLVPYANSFQNTNLNPVSPTTTQSFDNLATGRYTPITDPTIIASLSNSKYKAAPLVLRGSNGKALGILSPADLAAHPNTYIWVGQSIAYKNPMTNSVQEFNGYYTSKTRTPPYTKPTTNSVTDLKNGGSGGGGGGGGGSKPKPNKPGNPAEYSWNLPPHRWSLPVRISSDVNFTGGSPDTGNSYDVQGKFSKPEMDMYRRGRIWHNYSVADISVKDKNGNIVTKKAAQTGKDYGFQFLWNPEEFSTNVAIQMDTTPTAQDRFISGPGAFPATETISFTVHLDRTNDFACAYGAMNRPGWAVVSGQTTVETVTWNNSFISPNDIPLSFLDYYRTGFFARTDTSIIREKVADLFMRGTIADVEYLYLAINGYGPGAKDNKGHDIAWINGRGGRTADIGFLMPTLLNIDIGPLSYRGYASSLQVTHTAFTPEMIPIRSDVTISLNILATAGISGSSA